jgi:heme A synthase
VSTGEEAGEPVEAARHRRSFGQPTSLGVFAVAFVLLVAAAVCVGVGNFRPNTTFLPVVSFYLSGAAVVLTVIAVVLPSGRRRVREEPQEP